MTMRITSLEFLHADGGLQDFSFLKMNTDAGITGWAEYSEFASAAGLTAVIRSMGRGLIGKDPRHPGLIAAELQAQTRVAVNGLASHARAALEHACLDIQAKALGIPVHAMFGGAVRATLPCYWSHCGMARLRAAQAFGLKPLTSLDDLRMLGHEVAERGFRALKTNVMMFDGPGARLHSPGSGRGGGDVAMNLEPRVLAGIVDQMQALRDGAGDGVSLMLDLNFHYKAEGMLRIAQALEPLNLEWLEMDLEDAAAQARIKRDTRTPIASLECVYGRRGLLSHLQIGSCDVAIIDVLWNGYGESLRMAALADTFHVNVAGHNFAGDLAVLKSVHLCATIPNFRVLEVDIDRAPWVDSFYTHPLEIRNGAVVVPQRPGWGSDIVEEAVRAHPPKRLIGA